MKWTNDRSSNIEDRRGSGGGGLIFGGGLGTIVILAIAFFLGAAPSTLLDTAVHTSTIQNTQS